MYRLLCLFAALALAWPVAAQPASQYNLRFDSLAKRWDEAMPMGNGWLGVLVWQKEDRLRLSLDRVDLWDDRPMKEIDKLKFAWVKKQVESNNYKAVQALGDEPYEKYAAPTKIPGAAIEFQLSPLGKVLSNELYIDKGWNEIRFTNGMNFLTYVHATQERGYFGFENIPGELLKPDNQSLLLPRLIAPSYQSGKAGKQGNSVEGQGLERLGYPQGTITSAPGRILYHQPGWNNSFYEVLVEWQWFSGNRLIGQWTITNNRKAVLPKLDPAASEPTGWNSHESWWKDFWSRSAVSLPDPLIQRQYYLEMYKFACVARSNTPPISLQSVWTADNGNLPPWKGDFHHDLNTQLSYWPGYTGNHTDLTAGYTNWLWKVRDVNRKWTLNYFGVPGLNVPGVTTISGKEMGGWIQYSMSPTTVAWVAQHFYWQWAYSGDSVFLETRVKPYYREAAAFFSALLKKDKKGKWQLPLSSSPEYNDNRITAWFTSLTNYDLALLYDFYKTGFALGIVDPKTRKDKFSTYLLDLPEFATDTTGLLIAPGQTLAVSHRHHAHLMAIYPQAILSPDVAPQLELMQKSLRHLEKIGTREWCGYSFSWAACLYARAREADKAVEQLRIFASNFCSPNSFHLNGDQKGGQYSNFTYRPFTLEGNFAFAQGVHELLINSADHVIEVFPATPESWKNCSFTNLRAEGAWLVSAEKLAGQVDRITLTATVEGSVMLRNPFKTWYVQGPQPAELKPMGNYFRLKLAKGQSVTFRNGYE